MATGGKHNVNKATGKDNLPTKKDGKKWNVATSYEPAYCEMILKIFNEGGTKAMAMAALMCCEQTVRNWRRDFPEFDLAWTCGLALSEAWWDKKGKANLEWVNRHGEPQFRSEVWKFVKQAEFKAIDRENDVILNVAGDADVDKVTDLINKIRSKEI